MGSAQVGDTTLRFEDAGAGQPVLFIHGALIADAFAILRNEPILGDYRLITYRRRGYSGSSVAKPGLTVLQQAEDCLGLARSLGVKRFHLVGHSFGGAVALELTRTFPTAVASIALLEPALMVGESGQAYGESLRAGIERFHKEGAATVVDEMLSARWPQYRANLPARLPSGFDDAVAAASATFDVELPSLLEWAFSESHAREIKHPVLSVIGSESHHLSPRFEEVHSWLLNHMPDARPFVLPKAHHFLQLENSRGMAEGLASFWADNPYPTSAITGSPP